MKKLLSKKGFTLVELIVVLGILVILIAFLAPNFMGYIDNANKTSQDATAKTVYTALLAHATSLNKTPLQLAEETDNAKKTTNLTAIGRLANVSVSALGTANINHPTDEHDAQIKVTSNTSLVIEIYAGPKGEYKSTLK